MLLSPTDVLPSSPGTEEETQMSSLQGREHITLLVKYIIANIF